MTGLDHADVGGARQLCAEALALDDAGEYEALVRWPIDTSVVWTAGSGTATRPRVAIRAPAPSWLTLTGAVRLTPITSAARPDSQWMRWLPLGRDGSVTSCSYGTLT